MAQADSFTLKVFTPAGLLLEETTKEVKLPSADGEIGILPHFTRYAGVLGTGTMQYATAQGFQSLQISGGLIQFMNDTLIILTDRVESTQ